MIATPSEFFDDLLLLALLWVLYMKTGGAAEVMDLVGDKIDMKVVFQPCPSKSLGFFLAGAL